MVEASLFDRVVETVDIVAEEHIAFSELLESIGELTEERRVVLYP